ncbi:MAG TPA: hypothetical protein VKB34_17850, partial [Povalibacter sp.]|nr:hypothetical protein [Povalibacter sp.]
KPAYLQQLIAQRVAQDKNAHVRLQRFDTIEYCDNTANKAAAAAVAGATGATGHSVYVPTRNVPGGDSVLIRLQGEINGMPFEASRSFDYSNLSYRFNEMPAANPQYRAQFQQAMNEIADEIVAKLVAAQ